MTSGTAPGGILRKAGRQAKMQAKKSGTQAEALGTAGRTANANAPNRRGVRVAGFYRAERLQHASAEITRAV